MQIAHVARQRFLNFYEDVSTVRCVHLGSRPRHASRDTRLFQRLALRGVRVTVCSTSVPSETVTQLQVGATAIFIRKRPGHYYRSRQDPTAALPPLRAVAVACSPGAQFLLRCPAARPLHRANLRPTADLWARSSAETERLRSDEGSSRCRCGCRCARSVA